MLRPSPVPSTRWVLPLRVKGSKIRVRNSGGMPTPVSRTQKR